MREAYQAWIIRTTAMLASGLFSFSLLLQLAAVALSERAALIKPSSHDSADLREE